MVYAGETKVFLMENATTEIYTHVEKEIASGTIDGSNDVYTIATTPLMITGLGTVGTPESQYFSAAGLYFRKDVAIYYRKDGKDTLVNTNSNTITISGSSITFTTPPATTEADKIIVSSSHTKSDRSDEIISETIGGGGRPVEYVTVQGGTKVRIEKSQEAKTASFDVLSVDGGFVHFVNGAEVTETSGSDYIKGTIGAAARTRRTIITKIQDPETDNYRVEIFFNVVGVTDEGSAPSDGYFSETCGFECPPQDYCRLTKLDNQV